MKHLILIATFFLFNSTFSQEIIGTWKVKEIVENNKKSENDEMIKLAKDIFLNSEFTFLNNNKFQFINYSKSRAALELLKGLSNNSWILNLKNHEISIGSKKDNYSIAKIFFKEIDGTMYFQLHEFNFVFKMEKVLKE